MMVGDTVSAAAAASSTTTTGSTSAKALNLDTSGFLELLIAQLQYQDPLEPMTSEAMLTQLSQLTTVTELNELNDNFVRMADGGMNVANMSSLLGKTIHYSDGAGGTTSGIATEVRQGTDGWQVCVGDVVLALDDIVAVGAS